jgi:hypothetical protein
MSEAEKKPEPGDPQVTPATHGDPSSEGPPAEGPRDEGAAREPQAGPALDDEMPPELDEDAQSVLDEVDVRDLLRSALAPPPGAVAPDLLHGVQRKLRRRSRGKFYGDGWSTARSPRSTYLFTSLLMLALIALVFLVLIPWGSGALP